MGISTSSKKSGTFTEINITPLTDIFLVLLIIMMFMAPMFQAVDQDLSLPGIISGYQLEENEVTVAVTRNSQFFVNSAHIEESQLTEKLEELLETAVDKKIL